MSQLTQSFQVNVVLRHMEGSPHLFRSADGSVETTMEGFGRLIESGDYTVEVVPNWSFSNVLPTLLITEKEAK